MRRTVVVTLVGLFSSIPASAQSPQGFEVGLSSALLLSQPEFLGGGALLALRPGGRLRLQLAALTGRAGGLAITSSPVRSRPLSV